MATKLLVRRGTAADLSTLVLDSGEPGWSSDSKYLVIGDGSTAGGKRVAMLDVAQTFTGLQTVDLGGGTTGISVGTWLRGFGADAGNLQLALATFGNNNGPTIYSYATGGTRAVQAATQNGTGIFTFIGRGHDGSALTGSKASFGCAAGSLWSGTSTETYWYWSGTPSGSTTIAEWMRLQNGALTMSGGATFGGDVRLATKTPASASAAGVQGTFAWDGTYLYICTATNTWRRVAHATW